jgi:hypothetical protein
MSISELVHILLKNPSGVAYFLLCVVYVAAAEISRRAGHRDLSGCYAASAALHGALAGCHLLHLG